MHIKFIPKSACIIVNCTKLYIFFFIYCYMSTLQELPEEPMYVPPFTIRVYDRRLFGQTPLVGSYVIKSLEKFIVSPSQESDQMRRKLY